MLYVGWTKCNDVCDHEALYEQHKYKFAGLVEPSEEVKTKLGTLASGPIEAAHLIVLGKASCDKFEVVLDDPGCRSVQEFGARGYP